MTPLPGLAATRTLEGRLSYAGADHDRPYEVQRAAGPAAVEHIPLAALAELEARGDEHGIAAAQVLMGSREQAAHHRERARQIPELARDAESDRALLALLDSDPEAALDILDRVVEQAPPHPQALWNRALALRELGLPLEAARAFDQVAALNEPGWSAEARAQAERLRRSGDPWLVLLAGSIAAARAYLGELALRDPSCANRLRQHRMLATMLVVQNRMVSARQEMARAAALVADGTCEQPPFSLQVALAQAKLMREGGSAAEVAALQAELATFRAGAAESPGKLAFADHVEGRLLLGRDRDAAHALLRRAIAAAAELPADVTA